VQDTVEEILTAMRCETGDVEVQWNSTKMCYIIQVIWLGKSTVKQESHGLHRKSSVKWMNDGSGIMSTMKKEGRTTED
jgi:hypothetical protein